MTYEEIGAYLDDYCTRVLQLLRTHAKDLSFIEVDVWSLVPTVLLPRLADVLESGNVPEYKLEMPSSSKALTFFNRVFGAHDGSLSPTEVQALLEALGRIRTVCQAAQDEGVDLVLNIDEGPPRSAAEDQTLNHFACEVVLSMTLKSVDVLNAAGVFSTHSGEESSIADAGGKHVSSRTPTSNVYKRYKLTREGTQQLQEDVTNSEAFEGTSNSSHRFLGIVLVGGIAGQDPTVENSYLRQATQIVAPLLAAQQREGVPRIGVIYSIHSAEQGSIVTQAFTKMYQTHMSTRSQDVDSRVVQATDTKPQVKQQTKEDEGIQHPHSGMEMTGFYGVRVNQRFNIADTVSCQLQQSLSAITRDKSTPAKAIGGLGSSGIHSDTKSRPVVKTVAVGDVDARVLYLNRLVTKYSGVLLKNPDTKKVGKFLINP
ncbi:hypothetical protein SARC_07825 [Sphaeroforma arctica JP610]|uniref:Uncharacterized protein n=1 Tax=Sphaeroforma arctica JP610 TaxID=667725 RepID=A0A0L0FSN7_9EUKA|nr:hypothetical protein SARC_07825 [Sphaeroforma arctica JP610]KNC79795.1 hypothetical protein SARC_07825 [Sphaeroforma arctica JP610]|eukprot:XP_014153697.1 hypothetical protein SARC_07825 [Sphaeroforma arctica JP610]